MTDAITVRTLTDGGQTADDKYVVRDRAAVWGGSTNWTLDSWTREENVMAIVESEQLAAGLRAQLRRALGPRPRRGQRRVRRAASPVLTSGPVLGTLAEVTAERRVDVLGVCDRTQLREVFDQWRANGHSAWKMPLLAKLLEGAQFTGKRSTPYAPGAVHDYMHAKVTVADDVVFIGSFNLSRSGEMNAENVLEIRDAALADRMGAFVDEIRARYPDVVPPAFAELAPSSH